MLSMKADQFPKLTILPARPRAAAHMHSFPPCMRARSIPELAESTLVSLAPVGSIDS